jgi:hypothetical protein
LRSHIEGQRYSVGTIYLEIEHGSWASIHALHHEHTISWPNQQETDEIWESVPLHIRSSFVDKAPLCIDVSFRPIPKKVHPLNLCDYYCGKPNVQSHVFANVLVCDLFGRPRWVKVGAMGGLGEHFILRFSFYKQKFLFFY